MKLTKEECVGALEVFLNISEEECVNDDYFKEYTKDARETLQQLINEHFDNQFLDGEIELMISLLRRVEDELGMDITLLIDKLIRIQSTLPKEEGVVTCVEFDVD